MSKPEVREMHVTDDEITVTMKHPEVLELCKHAFKMFNEFNGTDFLAYKFNTVDGLFDVVVRPVTGKTPSDMYFTLKKQVEIATAELREICRDMESATYDVSGSIGDVLDDLGHAIGMLERNPAEGGES